MSNKVVIFAMIENIFLFALIGFVFWLTRSWWIFLLFIFINNPKIRTIKDNKNATDNKDQTE